MLTLLKRLLAYVLIPLGLILLLLPLNTHREEEAMVPFVTVAIDETLSSPDQVSEILPDLSNPEDDAAIQSLIEELAKMQPGSTTSPTEINPYGYPLVTDQDLQSYPALGRELALVNEIADLRQVDRVSPTPLELVPLEEWQEFSGWIASLGDETRFQYGNRIYRGWVEEHAVLVDVQIRELRMVRTFLGAFLLIAGILAMRGLYVSASEGVQVGKRSAMVLWDSIAIFLGTIFGWFLVDALLTTKLGTVGKFGDEQRSLFMGIFWFGVGCPILALFTTATARQSVLIDEAGISVNSLSGRKSLAWSQVKKIKVQDLHSIRRVADTFAPRKLGKVLVIQGKDQSLRIMEPPYPSTKQEILDLMTAHAPNKQKKAIKDLSDQWLSTW